ncbi:MAG: hypothetical protein WCG08_02610 [Paludibacter sp.]
MFENGLFASFIPELLMVLAYLFCLIVPGLKNEKQTSSTLSPKIIQLTTAKPIMVSVYQVTKNDFSSPHQAINSEVNFHVYRLFEMQTPFPNYTVLPLNGLIKAPFSRPPPAV